MSSFPDKLCPMATDVFFTEDTLKIQLADGREISAPLIWFSKLSNATEKERSNWRLIGKGVGIHWEDLDEDISVEGLLKSK